MYCIDCYSRLDRAKDGRCPACGCAFDPNDPSSYAHETNTLKMRVIARAVGVVVFVVGVIVFTALQHAAVVAIYDADQVVVAYDFTQPFTPVEEMFFGPWVSSWESADTPHSPDTTTAFLPTISGLLIYLQWFTLWVLAWELASTAKRRTLFWLEGEAELRSTMRAADQQRSR